MMREGKDFSRAELNKHFTKSDRLFRLFNDIKEWK
jgi:hypothetical protein